MKYFAVQRGSGGEPVPVVFHDEQPVSDAHRKRIIPGTMKPVPDELDEAPFAEIVAWAVGDAAPKPTGPICAYCGLPPELQHDHCDRWDCSNLIGAEATRPNDTTTGCAEDCCHPDHGHRL